LITASQMPGLLPDGKEEVLECSPLFSRL
jgi:hypothetical protein